MKIDPSQPFPQNRTEGVYDSGASPGPHHKDKAPLADEVRLSLDQSTIEALQRKAQALPEIRSERVAALRQAIQNGSYMVDDQRIAEAIYLEFSAPASASTP